MRLQLELSKRVAQDIEDAMFKMISADLFKVRLLGGNFSRMPKPGTTGILRVSMDKQVVMFDSSTGVYYTLFKLSSPSYRHMVQKRFGLIYVSSKPLAGSIKEAFFEVYPNSGIDNWAPWDELDMYDW